MPLGLANAPAIFKRTMDRVLHGLIGVCCFVYIDDIIIYSKNAEENAHLLNLILNRLRHAGLRVKPDKCKIAHTEVKLLGYIVGTNIITIYLEKTRAIATTTSPTSVTKVRRFLGMKIAAPLIALTRSDMEVVIGRTNDV